MREELPFRPQLRNDGSRWLHRDPAIRTEDALIHMGAVKRERLEKRRKQLDEKMLEDCNFF